MLILPENLPNIERLRERGVEVATRVPRGVRPVRLALLNLMPMKEDAELDYYRLLDCPDCCVEFVLVKMSNLSYVHTSQGYMDRFYIDIEELRDEYVDGLIITGAAVEKLPFEEIRYWSQLMDTYRWAQLHAGVTLHICWASLAFLYGCFGISKFLRERKLFGIFSQRVCRTSERLFSGIGSRFDIPFSCHAGIVSPELERCSELVTLAGSEVTGPSVIRDRASRNVMVVGHLEYGKNRLDYEYHRDLSLGRPIDIPLNYYENDDPDGAILDTWQDGARRFFRNWMNFYVKPRIPGE